MTLFTLSARNEWGEEIEKLGPFEHIILRPGSNWIEVRENGTWRQKSTAGFAKLLVEVVDPNAPDPEQPDWSY